MHTTADIIAIIETHIKGNRENAKQTMIDAANCADVHRLINAGKSAAKSKAAQHANMRALNILEGRSWAGKDINAQHKLALKSSEKALERYRIVEQDLRCPFRDVNMIEEAETHRVMMGLANLLEPLTK